MAATGIGVAVQWGPQRLCLCLCHFQHAVFMPGTSWHEKVAVLTQHLIYIPGKKKMRGCGGYASFCQKKKKKGTSIPKTLAFKKITRSHGLKLAAGETEKSEYKLSNHWDCTWAVTWGWVQCRPPHMKVPLATTNGSGHFPKYQCWPHLFLQYLTLSEINVH